MPDLIAQGSDPQNRWRRKLVPGQSYVIGRAAGPWSTPWDERISRRHIEVQWQQGKLAVSVLAEARNPVFYRGRRLAHFELQPGEHFVVGGTTFSLAADQVQVSLTAPPPDNQQTFTLQELRQRPYHRVDERINALSRLPEIITNATSEEELLAEVVDWLFLGLPAAFAIAIVAPGDGELKVLHADQRSTITTDKLFSPTDRLIRQALEAKASILHIWSPTTQASVDFTAASGIDWAFCVPVLLATGAPWAIYVTGQFRDREPSESEVLRDDLKFTELAAATIGSLRENQSLLRRQAQLGQFFSPPVLASMAGQDPDHVLAPRETEVSVLFCDLRGYSRASERWAHRLRELLDRVSESLGVMTRHILACGGVVGDFHGDSAMGFWGWPIPQQDAASRACQAALAIRREFIAARETGTVSLADFQVGIGIATGRAVAGKLGTSDQVKVTVFGPVVNLASRLEGLTKTLHAPILLDGPTAEQARGFISVDVGRFRRVAKLRPPGLNTAADVFELLPPAEELPALQDAQLAAYERAWQLVAEGDWQRALIELNQVPADDRVKDFLSMLILQHNRKAPAGWDGVVEMGEK